MTRYVFKMPDLGEGTVEAEIVAWHVKVGDRVEEDQIMAEVMTEKAAVEVPAPVSGKVVSITGGPGDMVRVGAELIVFDTESSAGAEIAAEGADEVEPAAAMEAATAAPAKSTAVAPAPAQEPLARAATAPRPAQQAARGAHHREPEQPLRKDDRAGEQRLAHPKISRSRRS